MTTRNGGRTPRAGVLLIGAAVLCMSCNGPKPEAPSAAAPSAAPAAPAEPEPATTAVDAPAADAPQPAEVEHRRPPASARVRVVHPLSPDMQGCIEMYSSCSGTGERRCTSAPLHIDCGDAAEPPGSREHEWLDCACP